jgi:hypothetical protein
MPPVDAPVLPKGVIKVFKLKDESGLPFDLIALMLVEEGLLPDWEDYFMSACRAGWTTKGIMRGVEELAGPFKWNDNPVFQERVRQMLELAQRRTGWTEPVAKKSIVRVEGI